MDTLNDMAKALGYDALGILDILGWAITAVPAIINQVVPEVAWDYIGLAGEGLSNFGEANEDVRLMAVGNILQNLESISSVSSSFNDSFYNNASQAFSNSYKCIQRATTF